MNDNDINDNNKNNNNKNNNNLFSVLVTGVKKAVYRNSKVVLKAKKKKLSPNNLRTLDSNLTQLTDTACMHILCIL
jgi:hypothetical protein